MMSTRLWSTAQTGATTGAASSVIRTHRRQALGQGAHPRANVAVSATQAQASIPVADIQTVKRMRLNTLSSCELGVSIYPIFAYDASGGGGWGDVQPVPGQPGVLSVTFDPQVVIIPDLSWRTASMFKVPIPPPLKIAITPQRLEGTVNTLTGEVTLEFDAEFNFTAGPFYAAPPLVVKTVLTTGYTKGQHREGTGALFKGLKGKLAGTATVERTGDLFMDTFLLLPNDALAIMAAELEFQ